MLELTGPGAVLWGLGVLYWLLAAGALGLALWKGRGWERKALWATVAIAVFGFLPGKLLLEKHRRDAYAREAWAYFKKKCDTQAGEKIYKTYTGVKSVLVIKPLPPATEKDLYDQFWYGDPYSDATPYDKRAELAASILASPFSPLPDEKVGRGFEFVETAIVTTDGAARGFVKYYYPYGHRKSVSETIEKPTSRFGLSWEDISTPEDRKYWVAGSRLRVVDLTDSTLVAERIGYFIEAGFGSTAGQRRPWLTSRGPNTTCPPILSSDFENRKFVLKALKPE